MSWWRTTETSLGVSFETCLRRCGDIQMGHRCYVLLRRRHDVPIRHLGDVLLRLLGDVPLRRCWVFHLKFTCDVARKYRETLLWHRHDASCCQVGQDENGENAPHLGITEVVLVHCNIVNNNLSARFKSPVCICSQLIIWSVIRYFTKKNLCFKKLLIENFLILKCGLLMKILNI